MNIKTNMIIDILKKSYRDPSLPRENYPQETPEVSMQEESRYNPYRGRRDFDRDERKLDDKIVQQLNQYKYRGDVKDILFRICKLGGFLPNQFAEWVQQAFYKFATDKVLTYNYYPKVKRFLDMFGKSTTKNIGLKNFIVIKDNSIRATAFIDRTEAVNFGTLVCTSGLFKKINDEDLIAVLLAYETAKGLLDQRDISEGFSLLVSFLLTVGGRQIYKFIKDKTIVVPSMQEVIEKQKNEYEAKQKQIKDEFEMREDQKEQAFNEKEDSKTYENPRYSPKEYRRNEFEYRKFEPRYQEKDYNQEFIPSDRDNFTKHISDINIVEKAQVFAKYTLDKKMDIIIKEIAPYMVSAMVLMPFIKWIFSGATGMQKEADLMSINVLLKTYGALYDMNNVFMFHKMYRKTITGNYVLNTSGTVNKESQKRMDYIYEHLVEIGYDVSKITEYTK